MDRALVERLSCPEAHAATPLVVRADAFEGARLVAGVIGCPVCNAEWPVRDGSAQFGPRAALPVAPAPDAATAAALLALAEPALVVTDGAGADVLTTLHTEYGATLVALDSDAEHTPGVSVMNGAMRAPLAAGAARAALLLRAARTPEFTDSIVSVVASGGRIVAAAGLPVPAGVRVLARNAELWVAEVERPAGAPVPLQRRGR